jgi:predicted N-acetyltransferase YhbS
VGGRLVSVRDERPGDAAGIRELVREAFRLAEHSSGTEWKIVDALREAGALTVSLVADDGDDLVGYVAVSPVAIDGAAGWHGLGPVAVVPEQQGKGIGSALIEAALDRLKISDASGCVVLGEPAFYARFGFSHDPVLSYADVPPPYFQVRSFGPERPLGQVHYHPAFNTPP